MSSTFELEAGRYVSIPFQLSGRSVVSLKLEVSEGKAVSIFLMTGEMLRAYANSRAKEGFKTGEGFKYLTELSAPSVKSCTSTAKLESGDYGLVVESTGEIGHIWDDPPSKVQVSISWDGSE